MKTRILYIACLMALLSACELIPEQDRLIPIQPPVTDSTRCHVLIEFTGFRCVNCPAAAEIANDLSRLYGERLIVVAMHPASNPFTQGKYDYTCPEADSIYQLMGGTAQTPFPTGNIDFLPIDNDYFLDPLEWTGRLQTLMTNHQSPFTNHQSPITSYWLVEDSVLGVQAMPDGSVNTAYYHRHVLRAISPLPFTALPAACDPAHCSVVTVFSDSIDNHILNAYETKWITTPATMPGKP